MCLGVQFWQISTSAYSMQRLQVLEYKWVCLQEIAMCGGLPPLSFANPPTHSGRRREATKLLLFFAYNFCAKFSVYKEYCFNYDDERRILLSY